jgi:hypothetical protein
MVSLVQLDQRITPSMDEVIAEICDARGQTLALRPGGPPILGGPLDRFSSPTGPMREASDGCDQTYSNRPVWRGSAAWRRERARDPEHAHAARNPVQNGKIDRWWQSREQVSDEHDIG